MQPDTYSREEVIERGKRLYQERVKEQVEPRHLGEFLALNVETGAYTLGIDSRTALQTARAQWPNGSLFLLRVGYPTAVKIGGRLKVRTK